MVDQKTQRIIREMRTAASLVRERQSHDVLQMEAAKAVDRWANELEAAGLAADPARPPGGPRDESEVERMREALAFYADPETYWACSFSFDRPTGGFDDDFEVIDGCERPGKLAREALVAAPAVRDEGSATPEGGPKRPEYEPKNEQQRVGYFVEECGEVLAAVGKTIRWGLDGYNPELPESERETNAAWVARELRDLEAAIVRLRLVVEPNAPAPATREGRAELVYRNVAASRARLIERMSTRLTSEQIDDSIREARSAHPSAAPAPAETERDPTP